MSMNQYLYKIVPTRPEMLISGPTDNESVLLEQHYKYLHELTVQGIVRIAGRTLVEDESTFGIVVFNAVSEDEARHLMNADPAVKQGVMHAELYPFRIALDASRLDEDSDT
ncbi:YCII-related protein [Marinomonas posidonica IVIA-Po-181]|uniref:YCII-related protein n=2 Tax=Marinomonas TaxID=28253 RepID=F6CVA2_MARPP|nr:YCII-related protein [Marinomonas posidonica IVIA-Po-181]